jgi:hypothetical protein
VAETISVNLASLADVATLNLYLYREDTGALLNAGGDALTHVTGGRFTAILTESRSGLGNLVAVVYEGSEDPVNVVWEGWLPSTSTQVIADYPSAGGGGGGGGDATFAMQQTILASVESLGSTSTEVY